MPPETTTDVVAPGNEPANVQVSALPGHVRLSLQKWCWNGDTYDLSDEGPTQGLLLLL